LVERLHDLTSAPKSRVTGDCHARFREGLGVKSPGLLDLHIHRVAGNRQNNEPAIAVESELCIFMWLKIQKRGFHQAFDGDFMKIKCRINVEFLSVF